MLVKLRAHLVLALVFFTGQCFAVAHATQHELSNDHNDTCQTCSVAHAGAGAPATIHAVLVAPPPAEPPALPPARGFAYCPLSRPRSRAPPFILA